MILTTIVFCEQFDSVLVSTACYKVKKVDENLKARGKIRRSVQKAFTAKKRPNRGKCRLYFRHSLFSDELSFLAST